MSKIVYIKPSGIELEVNDDEFTREYAAKNGWKVKEAKRKPKKKEEPKQLDKLI